MRPLIPIFIIFLLTGCDNWSALPSERALRERFPEDTIVSTQAVPIDSTLTEKDSINNAHVIDTQKVEMLKAGEAIDTRNVNPDEVIKFAETLMGTPYVYGSTDPKVGFDCSGFITYVFNNFKIAVPRSSADFVNVGKTVPIEQAKRGDIILFTDPDDNNTTSSEVGHMGLIISSDGGNVSFIHSTSGKAMAVAVSPLSDHYKKRFVRVGRIFPQNDT